MNYEDQPIEVRRRIQPGGFPSKRNKDKPWRPLSRKPDGTPKPMERIKCFHWDHNTGEIKSYESTFNGTLGMITQIKRGAPSTVLKVGTKNTPGEGSNRKRKRFFKENICHRICANSRAEDARATRLILENKIRVRTKLYCKMLGGHATLTEKAQFHKLNGELSKEMSKHDYMALLMQDKARRMSIKKG